MGRKNRQKKSRKNGGSSTGGNIHNDIIPDVATTATATTTTTIMAKKNRNSMGYTAQQWKIVKRLGFTTNKMNRIDEEYGFKGYPKSMDFAYGHEQHLNHKHDKAIVSFIQGAKNDSCVACMYSYADLQQQRGNTHLALPFYLECAIRGNIPSITELINTCYIKSEPVLATALYNFWTKTRNELGDTGVSEEVRKKYKKTRLNRCVTCGKEDLEDRSILQKCGKCKLYSYCTKRCQRTNWFDHNHMGECRQVMILKEFYKPCYAREIRDAIMRGENPKTMERLQILRTKLGLTRPKEEYEDLVVSLRGSSSSSSNDEVGVNNVANNNRPTLNPYEYLVARRDGTVHIGSTSNVI